jgi:outer membrane protein OmpA-like peptidoglycan-associated protein
MLLLASALTACSSQSERGSTGTESQAEAPAPEPEAVQYSEAPLPETPPVVEAAPEEPVVEEELLEEEVMVEEEVPELEEGPVLAQEELELPVVEEEAVAEEEELLEEEVVAEEEVPELEEGPVLAQEELELPVVEEEAVAEEEAPLEEEAVAEEEAPEEEVVAAAEEEHVVEDLGPLGDEGEKLSYAEEKTRQRGTGASAPQEFADEPVAQPVVVSFEAEPLFSFDKYSLRSDQRTKLDELVTQLNGTTYSSVLVTGHADRIGTDAYNQKLSERRANSVKAYLVRKGIPADKIMTEAYGETQPVTTQEECKGKRGAALISCYAPDRRVDVSVTGEKMN